MKYVLTWWERPTGSATEYEIAQKRVHGVFQKWEMPKSLNIHQFVVRVGEYGCSQRGGGRTSTANTNHVNA